MCVSTHTVMCMYTNINTVLHMEVCMLTTAGLTLLGGYEVEGDGQYRETCPIKDIIWARFWKMCSHLLARQGFKTNF